MSLTTAQLVTLQADVVGNPATNALYMAGDVLGLAAYYNLLAVPPYYVWRPSVTVGEIMSNGFDWTRVDNMSVSKARIWEWMTVVDVLNPQAVNVRAGVKAAFGAAGDTLMRSAIFGHFQKRATRIEQLFATGAGTASTDQGEGPALTEYHGLVDYTVFQNI